VKNWQIILAFVFILAAIYALGMAVMTVIGWVKGTT
jgi:hypothetical protein